MRVLIACERSGIVRRAFALRGHHVVSVDTHPAEDGAGWMPAGNGLHYVGDVFDFLLMGETGEMPGRWDLLIAHPPCTYLCSSGLHWNTRTPGRSEKTRDALAFVRRLMRSRVPRKCIENPPGRIGTAISPASQYVQPYQFGDDASKNTGLWLEDLPLLELDPAQRVAGRMVEYPRGTGRMVERWANQTDSGQNRLGPSPTRAADRARTYPGIAATMAAQWGNLK